MGLQATIVLYHFSVSGRAMHKKWLIPGKIPRGNTTLLIPYFGKEIPVEEFEILVAEEQHALQWVPQRDGKIQV